MQSVYEEHFKTEYDLYRAMNSKHTYVRDGAARLFKSGFRMMHEIEQQVRCHGLPGVPKCSSSCGCRALPPGQGDDDRVL
jgi:hypothetical protein